MSQQGVAVAVVQQKAVLLVDDEAAAASQGPSTHLEDLQAGVLGENEALVGPDEAKDYGKGSTGDHQVGSDGHRDRGYHSTQIYPALDGGRQFGNALKDPRIRL